MPVDDDIAEQLAASAASGAPALSDGTVVMARRNYDAALSPAPDPLVRVENRTIPGLGVDIPVRLYASSNDVDLPVVMFFHGGGWVLSSIDGHDHMARRLAKKSGALVVSVGYRLAPEHPFPAAHEDCWSATKWMVQHGSEWGGDTTRVAVCGDSAGGNLAAGVAIRARDEGLVLVLQALIYPCIDDHQDDYPSMEENASGYFLTAADMTWFWDHYVGAGHRGDPRAVPARSSSLVDVAPAFIQTAEYDPLRDEGQWFANQLRAADVPTTLVCYPGAVHGFMTRWHVMSRANNAIKDLVCALADAFDSSRAGGQHHD